MQQSQVPDPLSSQIVAMTKNAVCRNCNSSNVIETPNGILAPFFTQRVVGKVNIQVDSTYESILKIRKHAKSRRQRTIAKIIINVSDKLPRVKEKLLFLRPNATAFIAVSIRICKDCGFVGPSSIYPFDQLVELYKDYRSNTYNRDRCSVEPSYQDIMGLVGKSPQEFESRMSNLNEIIDNYLGHHNISTVLDWGGGEGKFIPDKLRFKKVTILDYSSEKIIDETFERLSNLNPTQRYDYIQICHVLEHVSEPRQLLMKAISHLNNGGYLYIELPQDRSSEELDLFIEKPFEMHHTIHEHLNLYSLNALSKLGTSLGLTHIHLQTQQLDFGWINAKIISGLFKKEN